MTTHYAIQVFNNVRQKWMMHEDEITSYRKAKARKKLYETHIGHPGVDFNAVRIVKLTVEVVEE